MNITSGGGIPSTPGGRNSFLVCALNCRIRTLNPIKIQSKYMKRKQEDISSYTPIMIEMIFTQ